MGRRSTICSCVGVAIVIEAPELQSVLLVILLLGLVVANAISLAFSVPHAGDEELRGLGLGLAVEQSSFGLEVSGDGRGRGHDFLVACATGRLANVQFKLAPCRAYQRAPLSVRREATNLAVVH